MHSSSVSYCAHTGTRAGAILLQWCVGWGRDDGDREDDRAVVQQPPTASYSSSSAPCYNDFTGSRMHRLTDRRPLWSQYCCCCCCHSTAVGSTAHSLPPPPPLPPNPSPPYTVCCSCITLLEIGKDVLCNDVGMYIYRYTHKYIYRCVYIDIERQRYTVYITCIYTIYLCTLLHFFVPNTK